MTRGRLGMAVGCLAMVLVVAVLLTMRVRWSESMPEWHNRTGALVALGFWVLVLVALVLGIRWLGRRWSADQDDSPDTR
jgi:uncharacterized membrane protein